MFKFLLGMLCGGVVCVVVQCMCIMADDGEDE